MNTVKEVKGILLGGILLFPLIAAQFLVYYIDRDSNIFEFTNAAYILYVGLLFLFSYFFSHKTFLFRWLRWICLNLSWPRSEKMAFFYFGLTLITGVIAFLDAMGFIDAAI